MATIGDKLLNKTLRCVYSCHFLMRYVHAFFWQFELRCRLGTWVEVAYLPHKRPDTEQNCIKHNFSQSIIGGTATRETGISCRSQAQNSLCSVLVTRKCIPAERSCQIQLFTMSSGVYVGSRLSERRGEAEEARTTGSTLAP